MYKFSAILIHSISCAEREDRVDKGGPNGSSNDWAY